MPNSTLRGHIRVPPADRAAVAAALPMHIRLTREEPGCLWFRVTPHATDPGRYDVDEGFRDRASFDHHQARVSNSAWGQICKHVERHYAVEHGAPETPPDDAKNPQN